MGEPDNANEFVGQSVSVELMTGPLLQGIIKKIDCVDNSFTLIKPIRNGVPCDEPELVLRPAEVRNLTLILPPRNPIACKENHTGERNIPDDFISEHREAKPAPTAPLKISSHRSSPAGTRYRASPTRLPNGSPVNTYIRPRTGAEGYDAAASYIKPSNGNSKKDSDYNQHKKGKHGFVIGSPSKHNGPNRDIRQKHNKHGSRAHNHNLEEDFDFEENNLKFNKQLEFDKIENGMAVAPVTKEDAWKALEPAKYRCDENVLQSGPVVLRQIRLSNPSPTELMAPAYATDTDLVVPCIDSERRRRLLDTAYGHGYSESRQIEQVGRSATEMIITLCGGARRLSPNNAHQRPHVVILVGTHLQGAQGLSCARQLASHLVNVCVLMPDATMQPHYRLMETELQLLELHNNVQIKYNVEDVPTSPVDTVVNALESNEPAMKLTKDQRLYNKKRLLVIEKWMEDVRAGVLALDPPPPTIKDPIVVSSTRPAGGYTSPLNARWQLTVCLPLAPPRPSPSPAIYLADLCIPNQIYKKVGIDYISFFENKYYKAILPHTLGQTP